MNRQGLVTMKIQEAEHNRLAVFKTANGYKSYTEAIRELLNRRGQIMLTPKQIAEQYSRETIEAVIKLLQSDPTKWRLQNDIQYIKS